MPAPTSWLTFLHLFGGCFNAQSQLLFDQLLTAWALCPGRRTLTRLWSVIPAGSRRRYGAYARWVREGDWSMDELWRRLVVQLVEHWVPGEWLTLLLDDTLVNKSGRQVEGAGFFHDPVTSTAVAHKVTGWGLNVVILALHVPSPWGGEPLALPIMACLRRKGEGGAQPRGAGGHPDLAARPAGCPIAASAWPPTAPTPPCSATPCRAPS